MRKIVLYSVILLCFFSCAEKDHMQLVKKLTGKWASDENDGIRFFEEWKVADKNIMAGKGFLLEDGIDTTFSENLTIELKDDKIYYVAQVKGENDNKPIKFLLVESEPNYLIFENPLHDFPQRIKYFFINEKELKVVVEGEHEGKNESNEMTLNKW